MPVKLFANKYTSINQWPSLQSNKRTESKWEVVQIKIHNGCVSKSLETLELQLCKGRLIQSSQAGGILGIRSLPFNNPRFSPGTTKRRESHTGEVVKPFLWHYSNHIRRKFDNQESVQEGYPNNFDYKQKANRLQISTKILK